MFEFPFYIHDRKDYRRPAVDRLYRQVCFPIEVLVTLVLGFIFMVIRPLIKGILSTPLRVEGVPISELLPGEGEEGYDVKLPTKKTEMQRRIERSMRETDEMIRQDPAKAADLVKNWLREPE